MAVTNVRGEQIKDASLTDADIAAANKDGVAGTASMRTLGTGSQQAAAGNHTHAIGTITGLGTNVSTFLATPTSANLAAALTDEVSSGSLWFGTQAASRNLLTNSSLMYAQRQARATLTSYATGVYTLDRWFLQHNTGGTNVQARTWVTPESAGAVAAPSGTNSIGLFKNNSGATCGVLVCQPIENANSTSLLSSPLTYRASVAVDATGPFVVKAALFEWTGTADAAGCRNLVASWTSNAPNFNTTTLTKLQEVSGSSGSGTWVNLSGTVTASGSGKNYTLAVWCVALTNGSTFAVSKAGLYQTEGVPNWYDPDPAVELLRCQRFYEKSYAPDVAPGAFTAEAGDVAALSHPTANMRISQRFAAPKRIAPTITTYDVAGATARYTYYVAGFNNGGTWTVGPTATAGGFVAGHGTASSILTEFGWTADAEI